jgi:hypothetical protein
VIALLAAADASAANDILISFKTGAIAEMVTTTLRIARLYFVFALLVGYLVEWAGKSPGAPRDYAGCTWRSFIVLFLLAFYTQVFGSVVNLSNAITQQVTPPTVGERLYTDFKTQLKSTYGRMMDAQDRATQASNPEVAAKALDEADKASVDLIGKVTGGLLMDSLVGLFAAVGLVVHWLIARLAILLMTLFYVLGPLALVFSIPAVSDIGTKWFSEFLSFCAWPIISGLLLRITVALGSHLIFGTGAGVIETLASSLLMTASAIATPVLCSKLVGGSVKSAASHGVDAARNFASSSFDYGKRGLTLAKSLTGKGEAAEGAASVVRGTSSATSSAATNDPGD